MRTTSTTSVIGRRAGDNGHGLHPRPQDGKPVSAPPVPPVEAELQEPPALMRNARRIRGYRVRRKPVSVAQGECIAALEAELLH